MKSIEYWLLKINKEIATNIAVDAFNKIKYGVFIYVYLI